MKLNKSAITLVEMSIAVVLAFLLLAGVLKIFSSGMKGSAKALTHQDNMETANILLGQIEYDLQKATKIINPDWNEEGVGAQWIFDSKSSDEKLVFTYDLVPCSLDGVHRFVKGNNINENNYFAKGHPVKLNFTHIVVSSGESNDDSLTEKHGMLVEIEVGSQKGDVATYTLKRLINVRSPY